MLHLTYIIKYRWVGATATATVPGGWVLLPLLPCQVGGCYCHCYRARWVGATATATVLGGWVLLPLLLLLLPR